MIRILIVDDHPALEAGLTAVLAAEAGLEPAGSAASEYELWPALQRTRPDVVLLDYHLPPSDGLSLCRRIKRRIVPAPAVVLFSAYADAALAIPARLAGADGLVHKATPARALAEAIRTVARGQKVLPPVTRELLDAAAARLAADDLPILGMALDETPAADIAATLRTDPERVAERMEAMIASLKVEVPLPRTSG